MDDLGYPTPPWRKKQASGDSQESPEDVQARIDFLRSIVPKRRKNTRKRLLTALVGVALLAAVGFGTYWQFFGGQAASTHKTKVPAKTATNKSSSSGDETAPSVPTQPYNSSDFNLSFNYPDGWNVVDNGSGTMTVTSPGIQLTGATGQALTGLVTMTIQKQGQLPASFSAGSALAVLNSQAITYTQPTSSQTSKAYLSFVQYASTTAKGGLDAIYLTGNYGYQKDQTIPAGDISNVDPLVIVSFTKCGNSSCTSNLTPLAIASASWSKSALRAPITTMLASLAFQ